MKAISAKLLLAVGGLVVSLALAEAFLRVWDSSAENRAPATRRLAPELRGLPKLEGIAGLRGRNTRGVFKRVLHRTNRDGFRGPGYSYVPPPGVFRIVLIGDSFSMGSGVMEEETYAVGLENLLDDEDPGRQYQVLNLGLGGFNLHASLKRLLRIGLRYQPELLIYGWTDNDIDGPSYRKTFKRVRRERPSGFRLWDLVRSRWFAIYPRPGSYPYELDDNYFRNPAAWSYFLESLDGFAAITEEQGVCGVVFLHTNLHDLSPWSAFRRHEDAVAAAAEERGLFVVSSFPEHRGRWGKPLWINAADSHPNAEGHALLAKALFRGLQALPVRCGLDLTADLANRSGAR